MKNTKKLFALFFLIFINILQAYSSEVVIKSNVKAPNVKLLRNKEKVYAFIGSDGCVDILERVSEGKWRVQQVLCGKDWSFGQSIDADEDILIIGAPYEDTNAQDNGNVYIYQQDDNKGNWTLILDGGSSSLKLDNFPGRLLGYSTAIRKNFQTGVSSEWPYSVAIGAPSNLMNLNNARGSAYTFLINSSKNLNNETIYAWQQQETLAQGDLAGLNIGIANDIEDIMVIQNNELIIKKNDKSVSHIPLVNPKSLVTASYWGGAFATLSTNKGMYYITNQYLLPICTHPRHGIAVSFNECQYPSKKYAQVGQEMAFCRNTDNYYAKSVYIAAAHLQENLLPVNDLVVYKLSSCISGQPVYPPYSDNAVFNNYSFTNFRHLWDPGKSIDIVAFQAEGLPEDQIALIVADGKSNNIDVKIIEFPSSASRQEISWFIMLTLIITYLSI